MAQTALGILEVMTIRPRHMHQVEASDDKSDFVVCVSCKRLRDVTRKSTSQHTLHRSDTSSWQGMRYTCVLPSRRPTTPR